ncbi:MAG: LuxR C-terminal-related transcriptional regulator [Saprospiraceae bacterium]
MTKTVLLFGFCMAILLALLKWAEYSFFARDLALEAYIGIVGLFCTVLGGWIGWNLTRPKYKPTPLETDENINAPVLNGITVENKFGLSPREYEVLVLIAHGYSYQEIADQLFLSITTVKTHASNIFSKMDVRRRTQAVMVGQKTGLLPHIKV